MNIQQEILNRNRREIFNRIKSAIESARITEIEKSDNPLYYLGIKIEDAVNEILFEYINRKYFLVTIQWTDVIENEFRGILRIRIEGGTSKFFNIDVRCREYKAEVIELN